MNEWKFYFTLSNSIPSDLTRPEHTFDPQADPPLTWVLFDPTQ